MRNPIVMIDMQKNIFNSGVTGDVTTPDEDHNDYSP